jgi:Flp pilus assembly protein TadG
VLLLFPVAFLAVLVLAAVAVDSAIAFLGERELAGAVAAAANDAATEAISDQSFYGRGAVELDDGAVERVAEARVRTSLDTSRYQSLQVRATVVRPAGSMCAWALEVTASATVHYLFAGVVPGRPRVATVDSTARSRPIQEDTEC